MNQRIVAPSSDNSPLEEDQGQVTMHHSTYDTKGALFGKDSARWDFLTIMKSSSSLIKLTFTECLLYVRHSSKFSTCINLFLLYNISLR